MCGTSDDRDDDEELDQREGGAASHGRVNHEQTPRFSNEVDSIHEVIAQERIRDYITRNHVL
jgi:hypothetical protein